MSGRYENACGHTRFESGCECCNTRVNTLRDDAGHVAEMLTQFLNDESEHDPRVNPHSLAGALLRLLVCTHVDHGISNVGAIAESFINSWLSRERWREDKSVEQFLGILEEEIENAAAETGESATIVQTGGQA